MFSTAMMARADHLSAPFTGPILQCHVHATFYKTTESIVGCFPPAAGCVATQAGDVLGMVQFSGIWPSCANPAVNFSFPLIVNGGTGPFIGATGWVNATQYTDYHFTYEIHFK